MKKENNNIVRKSNFELMRIVSMLFIVLYHTIYHGHMISNSTNPGVAIILRIIIYISIMHVNSFVVLSGYFQCNSKFKFKKMLGLIIEVIFYALLIFIIGIKLGLVTNYNYLNFYNIINLNIINKHWFINSYLIMYIFSDFINSFIHSLSKKQLERFLVIGFIIFSILPLASGGDLLDNTGYNFYNFIYLYIIGAYLRLYPLKDNYYFKNLSINVYRGLMIFGFILCVFLNYSLYIFANNINGTNLLFSQIAAKILKFTLAYSMPLIMIQTIFYFEFFKTINLKNKFINFLSKFVFGVYLIHENEIVRSNIYRYLKIDKPFGNFSMIFYTILIVFFIFVVCLFIEILRVKLFEIINKIYIALKNIKRKYKKNYS